jgi:hypothetical protein
MSCDFGVWNTRRPLDDAAAEELYGDLCEGLTEGVEASSAVEAFYRELTELHPEIDDLPEEEIGDVERSPWSCAMDRSPGHVLMNCVWSRADYVHALVHRLAAKHGLAVFDPQASKITHPPIARGSRTAAQSPVAKPWWRLW